MIRLLAAIGRFATVVAAILMVIAGGVGGYVAAARESGIDPAAMVPAGIPTWQEIVAIIVGAVVGLICAGLVFGALAALFEIRDKLTLIAARER